MPRNCEHYWLPTLNYINLFKTQNGDQGSSGVGPVCLQWVTVSMFIFCTIVISLVPEGIVVTDKFGY